MPPEYRALVRRIDSHSYQVIGLPEGFHDPEFKERDLAERWLASHLPQLAPKMQRKIRGCMRCKISFQSEGPQNRLCDPCRKHDEFSDWTPA